MIEDHISFPCHCNFYLPAMLLGSPTKLQIHPIQMTIVHARSVMVFHNQTFLVDPTPPNTFVPPNHLIDNTRYNKSQDKVEISQVKTTQECYRMEKNS